MLLLIDAGNTRVKWALAPVPAVAAASMPGAWIADGAVPHAGIAHLAAQWRGQPIVAVIISNVAGTAVAAALRAQLALLPASGPVPPEVRWFASGDAVAGVRNGYRDPHALGCDRLAALAGARALMPGRALIVATCGTATTVDALEADGLFIGGMILPGLGTMADSLAQRTAQLPAIAALATQSPEPGPGPASTFADNTRAAIYSGCLAAQAGAIERAVAAHGGAHCLLSGGAAAWIAPCLDIGFTRVENLVLTGLQAAAAPC